MEKEYGVHIRRKLFTVSIPPNYKGEKVVDILIKCSGVLNLKVEKIA
jgi:hypothetical protein